MPDPFGVAALIACEIGFVLAMVETPDARSHRGDPPVFPAQAVRASRRGQRHADVAGRRAVQQLLRRDLPQRNPEHGLRADAWVVQALHDGRHEQLQPCEDAERPRSSGEFRLRKVFMKLGISSPAELIRFDIAGVRFRLRASK
jgi:hypothetical protein